MLYTFTFLKNVRSFSRNMANLAHKEIVNVIFNLNLMAERNLFHWQLDKQYSDSTALGPHVLDKFKKKVFKYLNI